ncbi:MAG: hypothetical protein ACI81R_002617 [Bradymonadia bacterium]|jgi:hypothetical protein
MEQVLVYLAAGAAVVWFVLTIIWQIDPTWIRAFRYADRFHIMPNWLFFAPNPIQRDTHLLFRDRGPDGTVLPWVQLEGIVAWRAHHMLWHPQRRVQTSLFALYNGLLNDCRESGDLEKVACFSGCYTALLAVSVAESPPDAAVERQFALVASVGFGDARAVETNFVSLWHPIGGRTRDPGGAAEC